MTLQKILQTKLWSGRSWIIYKRALREYLITHNLGSDGLVFNGTIDALSNLGAASTTTTATVTQNITWLNFNGQIVNFVNASNQVVNWFSAAPGVLGQDSAGATGLFLGMTLNSTSSKFNVLAAGVLYQELAPNA
jgi:hypothetical protein